MGKIVSVYEHFGLRTFRCTNISVYELFGLRTTFRKELSSWTEVWLHSLPLRTVQYFPFISPHNHHISRSFPIIKLHLKDPLHSLRRSVCCRTNCFPFLQSWHKARFARNETGLSFSSCQHRPRKTAHTSSHDDDDVSFFTCNSVHFKSEILKYYS